MIINIGMFFQLGRLIIALAVLLIMLGTKDYFVELFTGMPEAGGVITWAVVLLFAVGYILKFDHFGNKKDKDSDKL